jgi:hypothetical protein
MHGCHGQRVLQRDSLVLSLQCPEQLRCGRVQPLLPVIGVAAAGSCLVSKENDAKTMAGQCADTQRGIMDVRERIGTGLWALRNRR